MNRRSSAMAALLFSGSLFVFGSTAIAGCRTVPIGLLGEFKRPTARTTQPFGEEIERGARIGLGEQREQDGDVCLRAEIIDIGNSVANIPEIIRQSARKKGIRLFLGLGTSDQALMAGDALRETGSVLLTPTASSERLKAGDRRTVLLFPGNSEIAEFMALESRRSGIDSVVVVFGENNAYSREMAGLFSKAFQGAGGKIAHSIPIRFGHFSLESSLAILRRNDYTHLFLPLFELDVARIISALREAGISKKFIGADSWGTSSKVIRAMVEGIRFEALLPSIYSSGIDTRENREFVAKYRAAFGSEPTDLAAFSYDGIRILQRFAAACPKQPDTRQQVEACLQKTLPFKSVTGDISSRQGLALERPLWGLKKWK